MRRMRRLVLGALGGLGLVLLLSACEPDVTLTVTVPHDGADVEPGDGVCDDGTGECTLRAAVMEANEHGSAVIVLGAETHELSIPGADEDEAATGDLDITSDVVIRGVTGAVVDGNGATTGDRVFHVVGGALNLQNITVTGGSDPTAGGIEVSSGSATLFLATVSDNTSTGGAGGLRVSDGELHVRHSTVAHNEGATAGGIEAVGGLLDVRNATVSSNTSTGGAGAAGGVAQTGGSAVLTYSTVAANTGDGIASAGAVTLAASVVAEQDSGDDCTGPITSNGYNVSSDDSCGLAGVDDLESATTDLAPLADLEFGGQGHVPGPGSALFGRVPVGAAGCGDPYTEDQRLHPRPQDDGCEPGAIEAPAPPAPEPGPLTNRTNFLGTGQQLAGEDRENWELAINGPCSSREQGDLVAALTTANFGYPSSPSFRCLVGQGGPVANPYHDPNGYVYAVEVPPAWPGGSLALEAYDASICSGDFNNGGGADWTTTFTVREGTVDAGDPLANPVVASRDFLRGQNCGTGSDGCGTGTTSTWQGRWCALHIIGEPVPGTTYFVQVSASTDNVDQQYLNEFALRANPGGDSFESCTGDEPTATAAVPYSASCPMLHPTGWTSGFRAFMTAASTFPLAFVEPPDGGRTLQVSLFDPGEGTRRIRILDPAGVPVAFDWEVVDSSGVDVAPAAQPGGGVWSGTADALYLDVTTTPCMMPSYPKPGPNRTSTSRYNDRLVVLRVPLPPDLEAAYGDATRWQLQVETCAAPSDRTTWKVDIVD